MGKMREMTDVKTNKKKINTEDEKGRWRKAQRLVCLTSRAAPS